MQLGDEGVTVTLYRNGIERDRRWEAKLSLERSYRHRGIVVIVIFMNRFRPTLHSIQQAFSVLKRRRDESLSINIIRAAMTMFFSSS